MLFSAPTRSRLAIAVALLTALVLGTACSEGGGDGDDSGGAMATLQDALAAHADGDLKRAEGLYRDALERDPDNKFAHYNLGAIAQSRGDLEEAAASYDEALAADPEFVPALFNLAIVRTDQGEARDATQLYKEILELEPDNAAAHLNLGFLLIERGREDRGRHELEEAVRLDPSLADRITQDATGSGDPVPATGADAES